MNENNFLSVTNEICDVILKNERFLVTSHENPDGDAIGSLLGLTGILLKLGKDVIAFNSDNVPYNYEFLPMSNIIVHNLVEDESFDVSFVLDSGELSRVGKDFQNLKNKGQIVNIDHHKTADNFGNINYVDINACAVGEMIYDIAKKLLKDISFDIAMNLYCSIFSDTGSFRYSNTTPKSLRIAAELLKTGINPWHVAQNVYENHPVSRMELLKLVLSTLEINSKNAYASLYVNQSMFNSTKTDPSCIDGFINYARSISGVEVAIMFREVESDKYKVSFRSRGSIDVSEIAAKYGGGGHKNAAGCSVNGSLEQVKKEIYSNVEG